MYNVVFVSAGSTQNKRSAKIQVLIAIGYTGDKMNYGFSYKRDRRLVHKIILLFVRC